MQFGSYVAVAVVKAGSYVSDWTPSLGTSICHGWSPKKTNDKLNKYINKEEVVQGKLEEPYAICFHLYIVHLYMC